MYPNAVVTSPDVKVIPPVLVLKLVTPAAIDHDLSADRSNEVPFMVNVLEVGV